MTENYAVECSLSSSLLVILRTSKLPESFELLNSHRLLKSCDGPHVQLVLSNDNINLLSSTNFTSLSPLQVIFIHAF